MSTSQVEKINEQIRALKLERIDAQDPSKITTTDPFVVADPTSFIEQRVRVIDQKIALLETERDKLLAEKKPKSAGPKHLQVKKEVARLGKLKKNQGKDLADIFKDAAKNLSMTPAAVKRAHYYEGKKPH
jgi:hypothetical protein